jgi:hypothetical protein
MMKRASLLLALVSSSVLFGCANGNAMSPEELKILVNQNLKPGDSEEEIIAFLEEQEWNYAFARLLNRYSARDPSDKDTGGEKHILIHVDGSKAFLSVEVDVWYPG